MPKENSLTEIDSLINEADKLIETGFGSDTNAENIFSDILGQYKKLCRQQGMTQLNDKYNEKLNQLIRQMKTILDNIPVGIVIVDENRLVTPSYSLIMHKLFNLKKISGMFIEDVLYWEDGRRRDRETFVSWLNLVFDISRDWDLIGDIGPDIIEYEVDDGTLYYSINYQRLLNDDKVSSLMIYVVDITERMRQKKILQEKTALHNFEMEVFTAMTGQENSSEIADFIFDTKDTLNTCAKLLKTLYYIEDKFSVYNDIFRHMHSIKGLARTYGMNEFGRFAHDTEELLSSLRSEDLTFEAGMVNGEPVSEKLFELVDTMQNLLVKAEGILKKLVKKGMEAATAIRKRERWIKVSYEKMEELLTICNTIDENGTREPKKTSEDLQLLKNSIKEISLQPFELIYKRLNQIVKDVSASLNKKVRINTGGDKILLPYRTHHLIINSLLHLLRNALDHGLETPELRKKSGKSLTGEIRIRTIRNGNEATIVFEDDGLGIDTDLICRKAVEKGLVESSAVSKMTEHEKNNLILLPGLSCKDAADEISGRGVGMDVVSDSIQQIGGTLKIESEVSIGSRFYLTFPIDEC